MLVIANISLCWFCFDNYKLLYRHCDIFQRHSYFLNNVQWHCWQKLFMYMYMYVCTCNLYKQGKIISEKRETLLNVSWLARGRSIQQFTLVELISNPIRISLSCCCRQPYLGMSICWEF